MKIIVLGAGAWGTALAVSAGRNPQARHAVTLWARDASQACAMQAQRVNARYLPGIALPPALSVSSLVPAQLGSLVAESDLVIVATPMAGLRGMLALLQNCRVPVAWLCKGFEAPAPDAFGLLAHEIQAQVPDDRGVPVVPACSRSGLRPTDCAGCAAHVVRAALVEAFHSPTLRVYANEDLVGVEVGGAVKNVLAIATGLCDGLSLGLNARAALITRGLAEMTRLGVALGARPDTFMGLSGLGDLVLTATGDLSRNRQVGLALASGQSLQQAVAALGHVAEGVYSARTVLQRARHLDVEMPITQAVVALLDGQLPPLQAVALLMGRDPVNELA
jgi:glycerol-3-phosphate dehydrogenase (NAD(P)+)